ncbi:hypothetical protein B566_EDAN016709 [Ephemera danica]|nr:hypothetical protein B566_EDAN016709 [Ephemera danica]
MSTTAPPIGEQAWPCTSTNACWSQFCEINVTSRKSCQKCRFERCVKIGMEISWVMSEAERQRLLNARLAKRRKLETEQRSPPTSTTSPPIVNKPLQDYLWPLKPETEVTSVYEVKQAWTGALQQLPPTPLEGVDLRQELDHALIIRSMAGSVQRFQLFANPLLTAAPILEGDKKALLQGSMLEMCILRGALNHVRGATLFERYFPVRLHEIHCRFVKGLTELALDQTTLLLFLMVILMNPERSDLIEPHTVEKIQDYYLAILNKYINGRYGTAKATVLYPKLLSKMADLRELSDCHQEQNLMLARHEVKTMKLELSRINQSDGYFEPPQKSMVMMESPQYEPASLSAFGTPQDFSSPPPHGTKPLLIPQNYNSPLPSVSSPCDSLVSSSSSSQRFFPQSPPFTESSSDDFYMQMGSYDDKEFMPPFLFGTGRCQFYDPPAGMMYEHFTTALDKASEGPLFEEECQALVQQCLQDGSLLSPPASGGHVESYYGSSYDTTDTFLISATYHR